MLVIGVMAFLGLTYLMSSGDASDYPIKAADSRAGSVKSSGGQGDLGLADSVLKDGSIAAKLENATAKYGSTTLNFSFRDEIFSCASSNMLISLSMQSRTRPRILETISHDDGAVPRRTNAR